MNTTHYKHLLCTLKTLARVYDKDLCQLIRN